MNINKNVAQLISLLIAIIAVVILYFFAPRFNNQPAGIFLPSVQSDTLPSYNGNVAVYTNYPVQYKALGIIHIEKHIQSNTIEAQQQVIEYAKTMAAKHGANALVVNGFGPAIEQGAESGLSSLILYATAIKSEQ